MASKRTIIKLGIIAVAGYLLVNWFQKRTLSKISYAAGGFRIHKITLSGVEFRIGMSVTNESDVPAPVSGFIGRLIYAWPGRPASVLGDLSLVNPVELPGFGRADLEFKMVSSLTGGAWEILNILTNGDPTNLQAIKYQNIDMKRFKILGTLKVGPLPITIDTALA